MLGHLLLRKRPVEDRTGGRGWASTHEPRKAHVNAPSVRVHCSGPQGPQGGGVCSNARGLLTASPAEAAARARDPDLHVSNVPQTGASDQSECPARGSRLQARGRQSDCAWQSPRPRHPACASRHPVLPPGDRVVVGLAVSSHESTGGSKTQSTGSQAVALPRDMAFSATFPATKNSHCQN